ncbi:MAG: biotin/lipoyl-binding protein [Quinella sp. 1Q5]|nr:biotin/lipoyl-binding protein [Quinella sp. 1Q5]
MKKNRILAVLLCLALAAGLVYGIGRAFAASRRKTVVVVPVTDLNYSWGDDQNSMEGMVASGFSQDIYLMDTESVDTVLVETGQHVKQGDVLMKYDATQTSINLEREILTREKLLLQMDVASKNLATLKKIKPASEGGNGGEDFPDFPDFPEPEDNTPDYSGVTAAEKLDENSLPYNKEEDTEESPLGSEFNPYRYLCNDETVITGEFLNRIRKDALEKSNARGGSEEGREEGAEQAHVPVYCVLEVREGNKTDGALKRAWIMDAAALDEAPAGWEGSVNLAGRVKESHFDAAASDRLDSGGGAL